MKFSIRDLLLLIVIASLATGWWVNHQRQKATIDAISKSRQEAKSQLNRLLHVLNQRGETVSFSDMWVTIGTDDRRQMYAVPSAEGWRHIAAGHGRPVSGPSNK
jgi:hypothetical protein